MTPEMKYFALGFASHYVVDIVVGAFLFWVGWYGSGRYHRHNHYCIRSHMCSVTKHIRGMFHSKPKVPPYRQENTF